ncbi:MAG: DUF4870 domain-containing protein [Lentisphaerae bacterium]|nr:DUF4870 domain-containing protein [Lentisphaerota bacterium]
MSDDQNPQNATPPVPPAAEPPATEALPVEATVVPTPSKDERTLALLSHLLGAVVCFPAPLIIWLLKKDTMPFVNDQAREALNFQITIMIAYLVVGALSVVTCGFGSFLSMPVWIVSLVFGIMGGLKANEGVLYRYPYTLRLVK